MIFLIILIALIVGGYFFYTNSQHKPADNKDAIKFVTGSMLEENINFYRGLDTAGKARFEQAVKDFLEIVRITGVDCTVDETDKLMIAASAVIPVFAFEGWRYSNLREVLLYSDTINESFETKGEGRTIMGMVGSGYMEGKMLLSKHSLQLGFNNRTDKSNTAIHEFVHLVDKMDGATDGIPELLLSRQYVLPWLNMMHENISKMAEDRSDIDKYGMTNQAEFLAVAAEYFFERPDLLKIKHPELFGMLEKMFGGSSK